MTRYPLAWPDGWKRTAAADRKRAQFNKQERRYSGNNQSSWMAKRDVTIADGTTRVLDSLRRFGVLDGDAIISTNLVLRMDGLPRSEQRAPEDPGVAVYWTRPADRGPVCMAVDRYDRVADNLAAIAATLEAMRSIERHGGAQILARAFTGFTALPRATVAGRPWRDVLGVEAGAFVDEPIVRVAYRAARSKAHPDRAGGSHDAFLAVQTAYEEARRELGFTG